MSDLKTVAYQYLFNGPTGEIWRDSPDYYNGQKAKASRALVLREDAEAAIEAARAVLVELPKPSCLYQNMFAEDIAKMVRDDESLDTSEREAL